MAHPWHLVTMRRHHEIGPLVKESAALRAFLRYCYGSASLVTRPSMLPPHQQPSLAVSAGAPHEERR